MRYTVRPISDRTTFTGKHRTAPFGAGWSSTLDLLDREVRQIRGRDVVLEIDVTERMIRLDGQPYANARPSSPAVRLAFESMHGPLTYGTDAFVHWQDNVRAIALGLEALRKVDRYGITKRGEQYTGFKAIGGGTPLPAGPAPMTRLDAAQLLERLAIGDEGTARDASVQIILNGQCDMARVVRDARMVAHPDRRNGDHSLAYDVDEAARVLAVTR